MVEHTPTRQVQDSGLDTQHGKHPLKDEQHFRFICCLFVYTLVPPPPIPLGLDAFGSALSFLTEV